MKKFKRNQTVKIERDIIAPSLRSELPDFVFWNEARVTKQVGERVLVKVLSESFWFNSEVVSAA